MSMLLLLLDSEFQRLRNGIYDPTLADTITLMDGAVLLVSFCFMYPTGYCGHIFVIFMLSSLMLVVLSGLLKLYDVIEYLLYFLPIYVRVCRH